MRRPVDAAARSTPPEHRERMRLGVVREAADEQDGDLVFFDFQTRSPFGPLDGRGGTESVDIHTQWDCLQSDVDPGRPTVAVAEIGRVIVGYRSNHPGDR